MKYTVVVADDEEEIRRSLVRRVKWEEIGFEVVGEAENGADALELVEKLEPDLLLTDIKMPFLSGIELARAVREVRPMVQIAFLSGFDDFTYAQQAIQYNIVSYMLKPISAKEIEAELIKIKKAMDQRVEEFTKERKEKLDIRKTQFLIPLLLDSFQNERVSEEALLERAEECELIRNPKPDNMQYVVLVTGIRDANGKDQTSYSSVNAVDMILKKYVHYVSCHLEGRVVSLIATTPGGMGKYLHIIVEEIVQSVERIMGYCCQVGVSNNMIELVICNNDGMAEGAVSALNDKGYNLGTGKDCKMIPVFGVDATDAAKQLIADGKMTATVKQDADGMAACIADLAKNAAGGKDLMDGTDSYNISEKVSNKIFIPYQEYSGK